MARKSDRAEHDVILTMMTQDDHASRLSAGK